MFVNHSLSKAGKLLEKKNNLNIKYLLGAPSWMTLDEVSTTIIIAFFPCKGLEFLISLELMSRLKDSKLMKPSEGLVPKKGSMNVFWLFEAEARTSYTWVKCHQVFTYLILISSYSLFCSIVHSWKALPWETPIKEETLFLYPCEFWLAPVWHKRQINRRKNIHYLLIKRNWEVWIKK